MLNMGQVYMHFNTLLDQVKADMNLTQGDVTMFIPDMPNVPPQYVPVMIAQAASVQLSTEKLDTTIGVCQLIPSGPVDMPQSADYSLGAVGAVATYLDRVEHTKVYQYLQSATTTEIVLQQPKHGRLDANTGKYYPELGYLGKDSVTYLVEIGGHRVKVIYFIQMNPGVGDESYKKLCPNPEYWKISSTLDADGNSTITSVEYQSPIINAGATTTDTAALAATLSTSILSTLSVDPSLVTFNLADLAGGAVGQTTGTTITLDTNAAGHNWYIDTTPWDNSEYLPTSNPYEWVAKAGIAAYGKMDMLSVLLHEYGHALGINHSADKDVR
jgi:hypothetical protein